MPLKIKILLGRFRRIVNQIILRRLGFELVKIKDSESLTIAHLIDWSLQSLDGVRCIQVGAHDGVRADHLVKLRQRTNWQNWLLEPQPTPFRRLQSNTRNQANTTCLPLALVPDSTSTEVILYHINTENTGRRLPGHAVASQLSSLRREKLETELSALFDVTEIPPDWIQTTSVQTITWDALIAQSSVTSPELVALDTEGLDGQLIQAFPFERFRPQVIVFENMWLNDHDFDQARALLGEHEYQTITIGLDSIAIQRDLFERNTKFGRQGIKPL